ncbi:hypothetical protein F2P45_33605 [Massilia sp. CCM 8733]|uniref:Uncharacterized protein n=1 Tax=Massilia mucilaginosa TaxID=2609282 RepID=A0ABX0P639_9BURK|nr:hypothetical protein [Massilia mucilaginosa]NHZ93897.1 hypothetical protein [Massilia mucilaginosa]
MFLDIFVKKESIWNYETSATGGVGLGFFAASGGLVRLKDPSGKSVDLHYGAVGLGLSKGFKSPKLPKLPKFPQLNVQSKSGGLSTTDFPAFGNVFVTKTHTKDDLTIDDIKGICIICEIGAGYIAGYSATAILVGINPAYLGMGNVGPVLAAASAKGIIIMHGVNAGLQIGGGVTASLAYLR